MKLLKYLLIFALCSPMVAHSAETIDGLEVCDSSDYGWSTECVTPCGSLNVTGVYPGGNISDGSVMFCTGQATKQEFRVTKIQLSDGSANTCTIFTGSATFDLGSASKGQTLVNMPMDFSSCKDGVRYDRLYITSDRLWKLAGYTTYPDGSGKIARTTSTCAADSTGTISDLSWLDTMNVGAGTFNDATLCYFRQTTSWSTATKKAELTPSTTDYSASSNQDVYMDAFKEVFVNSIYGTPYVLANGQNISTDGFYLERSSTGDAEYGSKVDPSDSSKVIDLFRDVGLGTSGLATIFNGGALDKSKTQTLKISYYAGTRSGLEYGIRFLWRRSGTSAQYLGVMGDSVGISLTLSQN